MVIQAEKCLTGWCLCPLHIVSDRTPAGIRVSLSMQKTKTI